MCDYTQVEYCCQHLRFVVQRWCSVYERTNKVCAPNVTHLEIRHDELCCKLPSFSLTCRFLQGSLPQKSTFARHSPYLRTPNIARQCNSPDCRPRSPPPWEHMIRRSKRATPYL
ncbi:uncharacterized protein F4812DRAFT_192942 [Daldinia caldariorum]|uniref:uncharacterized protein n=1 Tax=Daldinia caldariorum TaxID=326644 RepID=UPI002007EBCF|nr:uncharacterized protein F4812DRAFT_192942 [Daldinia caldariorum]KAI1471796.1 hypothetical protein F4812DRAFT_192942 [Daldinia caldariorum]